MNLKDEIREKLGKTPETPKSTPAPRVTTIIKKVEVSDTMKDIFKNIDENLNKTWGIDNNYYLKHGRPKYKNLWKDWLRFKEWFEQEIINK